MSVNQPGRRGALTLARQVLMDILWQLSQMLHICNFVGAPPFALSVHQLEKEFVVAMDVSVGRSRVVHRWKRVALGHWLAVQAVAHHLHVESIWLSQCLELLLALLVDTLIYTGMGFGDVTSMSLLGHGEIVFGVLGAFFRSPQRLEERLL
jgi:hypothetical protein